MRIALFGSPFSKHFVKYIQHLIHKIESEKKQQILVEEDFFKFLEKQVRFKQDIQYFKSFNRIWKCK